MALNLICIHATQERFLILPLLRKVAPNFILNVLFINWHDVRHHLFQLRVGEEIIEFGDVDEKYVGFFQGDHPVLPLRDLLMAITRCKYIVKMLQKFVMAKYFTGF